MARRQSLRERCPGEKGDVIRFRRGGPCGCSTSVVAAVWHYAIQYDDYRVIHVNGIPPAGNSENLQVTISAMTCGYEKSRVTVEEFCVARNGSFAEVAPKPANIQSEAYDGDEVVRRAEAIRQEHGGAIEFNVVMQNCEHFANHCRYGESKSEQAISLLQFYGGVAGSALLVGIVVLKTLLIG